MYLKTLIANTIVVVSTSFSGQSEFVIALLCEAKWKSVFLSSNTKWIGNSLVWFNIRPDCEMKYENER